MSRRQYRYVGGGGGENTGLPECCTPPQLTYVGMCRIAACERKGEGREGNSWTVQTPCRVLSSGCTLNGIQSSLVESDSISLVSPEE